MGAILGREAADHDDEAKTTDVAVENADQGALATNLRVEVPMASETAKTVATATGSRDTATGVKATAGEGTLAANISEEVGGVGETMSMAAKDRVPGKTVADESEVVMPSCTKRYNSFLYIFGICDTLGLVAQMEVTMHAVVTEHSQYDTKPCSPN